MNMKKILPMFLVLAAHSAVAQLPASSDSSVGIGTASPLYRLDVQTAQDNDGFRLRGIHPGNLRLSLSNVPAGRQYSFLVGGPGSAFGNGNFALTDITRLDSARLLINGNTGHIAIGGGTHNPPEMLTVNGNIQAAAMRLTHNAGTNRIMASDATGMASWQPAESLNLAGGSGSFNYITKWTPNGSTLGNSQMVDDGTHVGVGNVTPQYKLDLGTAIDNDGLRLRSTNTGNLRLRFNNAATNKEYSLLLGGTTSPYGNGNLAITDGGNLDSARLLINGNTGNIGIGSNDPNPAEKLTVKGTVQAHGLKLPTNAGAGKVLTSDANGLASWQAASVGTVMGGGTLGYLPLWTPNGTSLGTSQVRDNGTFVGIGLDSPQVKLDILAAANNDGLRINNSGTGNASLRIRNSTSNKEYNMAVGGSSSNFGNGNFVINDMGRNDTASLMISGSTGYVGIGLGIGHSITHKLTVGGTIWTQGIQLPSGATNRILVSDAAGNGTWQTPGMANLVAGSGTLNYLPKWTPNGFTQSNSQIVDDGTNVGIGNVAPLRRLDITSPTNYTGVSIASPQIPSLNLTATNTGNTGRELIRFGEPASTPGSTTVNAQIGYYRSSEPVNGGNLVLSVDNAGTRPDISISKINNGNVGIGVANAGQKLDVNGTVRSTGLIIPTNAGTGKVLTSDALGNATWQTPASGSGTNAVIYSNWMTAPGLNRDTTVDGTCVRIKHIEAPSLSTAALSNAVIMVYMRVGSIGPYHLPYTSDAGGATNQINCIYNPQKIFIYRHTFNTCRFSISVPESFPGQPVLVNLAAGLEFRYVIILGTQSSARMAAPTLGPNEHFASSIDAIPDMGPSAAQVIPGKVYSTVRD
jgi:hypothetical protein